MQSNRAGNTTRRTMAFYAVACLGISLFLWAPSKAWAVTWSEAEIDLVASHGPWPPPLKPDLSNRLSGKSKAIEFGKTLFFDNRLSKNAKIACATCHDPNHGFAENRSQSVGLAVGRRNAIGLHNTRFQTWFGWDGAKDSLWGASLRPIIDASEMGLSLEHLARLIRKQADLKNGFMAATGQAPEKSKPQEILVLIAKSIAAYQETLITPQSNFDRFRAALINGDAKAISRYPIPAQRGLKLFIGRGQCNVCHHGPMFSNREFATIGRPFFLKGGGVDKGRYGGIQALKASPYNRLGEFNDNPTPETTVFTRHLQLLPRNWGEFKVPSLRNVKQTRPYMHDGSVPDLRAVVRHYSELKEERLHSHGESFLKALRLSDQEIADLVAFLETL